mmetsp:Transcript_87915/g.158502  ORF Transcript_87915/g.158502 Transcript_87915/m.158502 type:complete len:245 (-) Transcript_87915:2013-2747(-)
MTGLQPVGLAFVHRRSPLPTRRSLEEVVSSANVRQPGSCLLVLLEPSELCKLGHRVFGLAHARRSTKYDQLSGEARLRSHPGGVLRHRKPQAGPVAVKSISEDRLGKLGNALVSAPLHGCGDRGLIQGLVVAIVANGHSWPRLIGTICWWSRHSLWSFQLHLGLDTQLRLDACPRCWPARSPGAARRRRSCRRPGRRASSKLLLDTLSGFTKLLLDNSWATRWTWRRTGCILHLLLFDLCFYRS